MASTPPPWFVTGDRLKGEVFPATLRALSSLETSDAMHESMVPEAALFHLSDCLAASVQANGGGQHSVAISLLRGCVEALTLVDLGLQSNAYRLSRLTQWNAKQRTAGDIRRDLGKDVWPRYGHGLWDESWGQLFGNLARALHPYAHYSPDLMGWQMSMLQMDSRGRGVVVLGPSSYDPLKATRITLLHTLVLWTVGRLTVLNAATVCSPDFVESIETLRVEVGNSGLLFREGDWGIELMPHVWFQQGVNWREMA